jgi:zinc protease
VASKAWFAAAFPGHPYGRPVGGTAESLKAISRDDLLAARARQLTRANARIGIVGAIGPDKAGEIVDVLLAGLEPGTPLEIRPAELGAPAGVTVIPLDVPQSAAVFGQRGLPRADPDFMAAYVMNYILGGGGFASRLMEEVREKRGLAYGVYSYLANMDESALYLGGVQTANERMAESLKVIRDEWARMATGGVTADELENAKKYLTGAFPLSFDSNARIANYLVFLQEEKLGVEYIELRNKMVEAVTLDDIRRVAARLLAPQELSIVVVGKPAGL